MPQNDDKPTRGFFTMAQNNSTTDYVRLAYAMALSLKSSQSSVSDISIGITPGTDIPQKYEWVFDKIIEIPWGDDAFDVDWKLENEWKAIHMSPYDETIKLDADMMFFNDISAWWDLMSTRDFYVCNRVVDYRHNTATSNHYRQVFRENKLPNIYTAFMYFKKTPMTFELFKLVEALFVNWHVFSEICLGYKHRPEKPSTDVVFALALKLLDLDQIWYTENEYPTFVHMKTKLQGWSDDGMGEDWLRHIDVFVNDRLECKIGNHMQLYPFHYHEKDFITDDMIDLYERHNGFDTRG
jgi:hypothetical protein